MPFISREEKEKLDRIESVEQYETEMKQQWAEYAEDIKIRCDALVEKTQKHCETLLDMANLEAENYKKMNKAACAKYMDAVIARCNEEKSLVHLEANRIINEAKKMQSEAKSKVSDLYSEYETLKMEIDSLNEDLMNRNAEKNKLEMEIDALVKKQLAAIDNMEDGLEFENYFAQLLKDCGYTNVKVTRSTGDSGVDVIARFLGIPFAFQCKRYNQKVGNQAVQEVFSGMSAYDCAVGVVVTNNFFTSNAVSQASFNHVLLWGRQELSDLIKEAFLRKKAPRKEEEISIKINGREVKAN